MRLTARILFHDSTLFTPRRHDNSKIISTFVAKRKRSMIRPIDYREIIEQEVHSDIVAEPQYDMFFNNGNDESKS